MIEVLKPGFFTTVQDLGRWGYQSYGVGIAGALVADDIGNLRRCAVLWRRHDSPAISVLSAVEGLEVATPALKPYVIPLSLIVLVGLFLFQRKGTASVGDNW
jgi:hypothetical protein